MKKVTKGYISPLWGEAPTQAIYIKNCVVGDLLDVITCAKFQNEIFNGYYFTGGRIFLLIIEWALQQTVRRYCAAYDKTKPHGEVEPTSHRGCMAPEVARTALRLKILRRQYLENQAR